MCIHILTSTSEERVQCRRPSCCSKVSAAKINHPVFVRAGLRDQAGQRKRKEEARKPINLLALDS